MNDERARFAPGELAMVLSHYDLGVVASARELPRGSRRAPKLLLKTDRGAFLLKRRAPGRGDVNRVRFTHRLIRHLLARNFRVPNLVLTRNRESLVQVEEHTYEVFEFVDGHPFDGSLEQTLHAGRTLARFHRAVLDFQPRWRPPAVSYHDRDGVRDGLNSIPTTTAKHDSVIGREAELLGATQTLYEHYDAAAAEANDLGIRNWRSTVIHGDWHPGNLVFTGPRVGCVLDLDSARHQPPLIDVANGMLQFSMLRGSGDPLDWPDFFDETRMRRFFTGYSARTVISPAQRQCLLPLMIESLIAETVVPIAATGSFGTIPGFGIILMVRRKVHWLLNNRQRLLEWLLD